MAEGPTTLLPWLIWAVPFIGAVLTPVFARAGGKVRDYAAVFFSSLSALMASLLLPQAFTGETLHLTVTWIQAIGLKAGVLADPLSIFMANIVGWISLLIMIYSLGYMKGEPGLTRYWFFMNFFIGSMQLILFSDNFLQLFFGWEGVGLASYALIGFWHSDEKERWVGTPGHRALGLEQAYSPSHAGMKALVTTKVGDISFLIGIFLLFYASGTFSFTELAKDTSWATKLSQMGLLIPAGVLIFGGAIGKSAQFPLQEWLPDAMAGPTSVSALIHAATMVKAGVFLVARVGPLFYVAAKAVGDVTPFFMTIAWIGAFTAFLAATQAAVNREMKKVMAYSTVSQIGYMMLALGAAGLAEQFTAGFTAGIFHLSSHAIFKAALFMGAGALLHATHTKYMDEMGGLKGNMKLTWIAMLLAGLSLAGLPPLSGFWSKDAVLASTLQIRDSNNANALFLLSLLTALITAFYTFRMIGMVFHGQKSPHLDHQEKEGHGVHEAPAIMRLPYMILAIVSVIIGITVLIEQISQVPLFEGRLFETFGEYLHEEFKIPIGKEQGINPIAVSGSILVFLVGGGLGYYFYWARKKDVAAVVGSSSFLSVAHNFFLNRWYINAIYYKIFISGSLNVSRALWNGIEQSVIDRISDATAHTSVFFSRLSIWFDEKVVDGVVNGSATVGSTLSRLSRLIQTGITETYVFAFILGIVLVILVMIFGA